MVLNRRQLYMLPTRHGLLFTLVLLVIFLAAVNYDNGLAYALVFLLVSVALVSMLHTHRNVSGLAVEVLSCTPVFAGQNAQFRMSLRNPADFTRVCLWVFCGDHRQHFHLDPFSDVQLEIPVPAPRRGYLSCPPLRVASAYPLGLQYTWSATIKTAVRGIVYPEPRGALHLPHKNSHDRLALSGRGSDGDDFTGLREYIAGDPPRHVHWKAVATHQALVTKQFGGEGDEEYWLRWEDTTGPTEARLSQLCRWVVSAEHQSSRYGLSMPGTLLPPDRGARHYHRCLQRLALWGLEDSTSEGGD